MSRTTRRRRTRRPRRSAETPEDTDAAQEPGRRVRPRETPVGAGAAAAPEPEEEEEDDVAVVPPNADRAAAHERLLGQMDQALTELPDGSEAQRAVLGTLVLAARDARNDVAAMENGTAPRTAVRYVRHRGLTEAQRAGWAGDPRNPFNIPRRGDSAPVAPRGPPRPPDRWIREEFEVETGRVVHQETIEGEPPRNSERHEYVIPH